jgi:methane/ammonia monooxygenase subunit C
MSLVVEAVQEQPASAAASASADRPVANLKPALIAGILICAFYVGVRIYEKVFGWNAGLDSFSQQFQTYWMTLLYVAVSLELFSFLALIGYLWHTRDHDVANVAPREELRRIFYLLGWILVYGIAFYWGASYFSEQDATWHQTVIRDTAFTPLNIIKFYISYPIFIIAGVGGFMYARTRLPTFACQGISVAYALFFVGPLMILPGAALSEWGCTFWYMEELFVAPLHWTFVFFGWFALAVFGVTLQILGRIQELCAGDEGFDFHQATNAEVR